MALRVGSSPTHLSMKKYSLTPLYLLFVFAFLFSLGITQLEWAYTWEDNMKGIFITSGLGDAVDVVLLRDSFEVTVFHNSSKPLYYKKIGRKP